jgi:hypothetical protein
MTAPTFRLVTNLGDFALTIVDERRIIARAPASSERLLLLASIPGAEIELRSGALAGSAGWEGEP